MAVKPKGPRSAEEADKAETFYDGNGEAIVDALGKPLITVQGWAEDHLTLCAGPGADRFIETLDLANRIVSMHASILEAILFDDISGASLCVYSWPTIVNRVSEMAGRASLRRPVWKVSNGHTSWTVNCWRRRDAVARSRPIYSPADVELIGDEPEAVYADRETIIHDSELALEWLIEKLREPPKANYPGELPPEFEAVLSLRDRQVFYALNPDLPSDFTDGVETNVRAEMQAAGIEYAGHPIEWLRSSAGGRYVEQRFNRLLESFRADVGNVSARELEVIAKRAAEIVAKAQRRADPLQIDPGSSALRSDGGDEAAGLPARSVENKSRTHATINDPTSPASGVDVRLLRDELRSLRNDFTITEVGGLGVLPIFWSTWYESL